MGADIKQRISTDHPRWPRYKPSKRKHRPSSRRGKNRQLRQLPLLQRSSKQHSNNTQHN